MLFWLIAFVLAAVSTLIIVVPLLVRPPREAGVRETYDEEVYRAQLRELARGRGAARRESGRKRLRPLAPRSGGAF